MGRTVHTPGARGLGGRGVGSEEEELRVAGYVYGVGAMGVQSQLPGPLSPAHPASPSHSADAQTFQIGTCRRLRAGMSVEHLSGGPDAPVSLCPPPG